MLLSVRAVRVPDAPEAFEATRVGALAYRLSDQGHEVVVAGDDVRGRRHPDVLYVRTAGDRLPFAADSFDAVVVPHLAEAPTALAEHARVLRPDGLVSTVGRSYDDSIPWMRKLLELVGRRQDPPALGAAFVASGLFHEPETTEIATWEVLDLAGLLRFARATSPHLTDGAVAQVHELFRAYGSQTGSLRLRSITHCLRARVDKSAMTPDAPAPDALLLDFR